MNKIEIKNDNGILQFEAIQSKYEAQIKEAKANLGLYFNNPVAIGEHSDMQPEYDKWIEQLATASDKLEVLKINFFIELEN